MRENKILASVSSSLKSVSEEINTLNENIGTWAEEYAFRAYQESLLELEVMVMEAALKTVQEKAKHELEFQPLLAEIDPQILKIFDKL